MGMTRLHELRHTTGHIIYDKSRDLYLVKEMLGHSDIRTSERYAGKPTRQVEEVVKKLDGFGVTDGIFTTRNTTQLEKEGS